MAWDGFTLSERPMSAAALHRPSIAVLDDDEAVRRAVSFALQAEGYAVRSFAGAEGLLATPGVRSFACFIIDLKLPEEDGLSVIRLLRDHGVTAPAILITTQPGARCRSEAEALHVPIVEKPLMGEALSDQVRRMIGPALAK